MNRLRPILLSTTAAGAVISALAWLVGGEAIGLGAVAGSAFAVINLAAFAWLGAMVFAANRVGGLLVLKMLVNALVVYALIVIAGFDARGIAIGYGALLVGLVSAMPALGSGLAVEKEN